jgi:predicted N-acetyltransferase YhbS
MSKTTYNIRLMKTDDFSAVVRIDEKVTKACRSEYYKLKFEELVQSTDRVPTSLVAEQGDGTVVGFIMGELLIGEFGISQEATLDTIIVDPDSRNRGIGEQLIREYIDHVRKLGARKVNTLVDSNDAKLMNVFIANQFTPSKTICLERSLA